MYTPATIKSYFNNRCVNSRFEVITWFGFAGQLIALLISNINEYCRRYAWSADGCLGGGLAHWYKAGGHRQQQSEWNNEHIKWYNLHDEIIIIDDNKDALSINVFNWQLLTTLDQPWTWTDTFRFPRWRKVVRPLHRFPSVPGPLMLRPPTNSMGICQRNGYLQWSSCRRAWIIYAIT